MVAPVHVYTDVRIYQKEAKTLVKEGYDITILARKEGGGEQEWIDVIPMPIYKNRLQRFLLQPWIFWKIIRVGARLYHLHNPDTLFIGFLLKMLGKSVIYDTHEDFTKRILMRNWIPYLFRRFLGRTVGWMESAAGRIFDAVIATQPDVSNRIGHKCVLIGNAPISQGELIERAYQISQDIEKGVDYRAIYAGYISESRGLFEMIEAMEWLNQERPARLWLIGPCPNEKELEKVRKMPGWRFVDYLGVIPQERVFAYMIRANVGLITIHDIGDHEQTSPNKIYEYQRFGIPFIASNFQRWRSQLEKISSGVFVEPKEPKQMAKAMSYFADHPEEAKEMGRRGQLYTLKEYNWEKESRKLLELYQTLLP